MRFWEYFVRQGAKEYSAGARLAAMAGESLLFVFGIPAGLYWLSTRGDERWRFQGSLPMSVVCVVVGALGLWFALWTVWTQFRRARGTPVPVMATKTLLTDGPYGFCRNPMGLGTLVFYLGVAILTSSFKAVLAVVIFGLGLVAYLKLIEEKELSMRFGEDYARYKVGTPFIIPRLSKRKKCKGEGN